MTDATDIDLCAARAAQVSEALKDAIRPNDPLRHAALAVVSAWHAAREAPAALKPRAAVALHRALVALDAELEKLP